MARRSGTSAIRVIPSASRLVNSLRDLGYDFPQAVADLVDNSITAGARRIKIDLRFEGPDSWFRIVDDGHGMSGDNITEAMRYGSQSTYGEEDLGKFGLGLKTASLSQCRRLSVASRRAPSRARIEVRELDLDHVIDSDRWEVLIPTAAQRDGRLTEPLSKIQGTAVLWQNLDRILGYKIPWGKRADSAVRALAEQLELHLGMTFHRYLAGEIDGQQKLRILINGKRVSPWDPFARTEPSTQMLPCHDIDVEAGDGIGLVRFQPFVLPPRERFSSEEAFHQAGGPRKWNAQQGFYIYRANRLIQSGGWCRMRAQDEHLKLARAAIDFFPDLDAAFQVNVAKVRVVIPSSLKSRLQEGIDALLRSAQAAYRAHASGPGKPERDMARSIDVRTALESAAEHVGERRTLRAIVRRLRTSAPGIAKQIGW